MTHKTSWKMRATSSTSGGMIADRAELERGLRLLADPKSGCEIMALPSGRFTNLASTDIEGLIAAVDGMPNGIGVYVRINPVPVGLGRPAKKADIKQRRWIYIDVDPAKPESEKDNPATDAEKIDANQLANDITEYLSGQGWPAPVIFDSGNGCALLWRIEIECSSGIQSIYRKFLISLQSRFPDCGGVIDGSVHDATRLIKLPGTWAKKGQCSDDRPFRPCRIFYVPEDLTFITLDMISAVAEVDVLNNKGKASNKAASSGGDNFILRATNANVAAYGRAALDAECARIILARPQCQGGDGRNNALNKAAFSLGQLVGGGELERAHVISRLTEAARQSGLADDPGCGERGIESTIRSGLEAGVLLPRAAPRPATEQPTHSATEAASDGTVIVWASTVTPRPVEWLWPGRIPLGKLTTFAGVGGLGKTFVLCDITARITTGAPWPDSAECAERGKVLFISGEDDPDDTLVPRMIELGADLTRVAFLKTEVQDRFTMADLKTLETALDQMGDDVRFVAIDPPTAYLGGVNDHKNAELRQLLTPLKSWAGRRRVAIVFNTHVNKPQGAKVEAMMRVMGSVAWVNAVRAAHMFARDPNDPERRLFCGMKNNLGKEIKGLAYCLESVGDLARVKWLGEVDTTADEALNKDGGGKKKRSVVASEWLAELFANVDKLSSDLIWRTKDEQTTLSKNALKEAKEEMGIRAKQEHDDEGNNAWVWYWPKEARASWVRKLDRSKKEGQVTDEIENDDPDLI